MKNSKPIGIATYSFQYLYGDNRMLEIVKEIGAEYIDYSLGTELFDVSNPKSLYSKGETAVIEYFTDLKNKASAMDLKFYQTHGRMSGFGIDETQNELYLKNARLDCLATAILGAEVCVFHNIDFDPKLNADFHFDLGLELFKYLLSFAEEFNVKIATETFGDNPQWGENNFFGKKDNFLKFFKKAKAQLPFSDRLTICIDTGHTNKAARFEGEPSVAEMIRLCGKDVTVLHLNDNNGVDDEHRQPYGGTIDWKAVIEALDEIGFDKVYNLELNLYGFGPDFRAEGAEFSIRTLKNI